MDHSLKQQRTDYVNLINHRWDYRTPDGETPWEESLHDLVKARKAHYIGASGHVGLAVSEGAVCRRAARLDALYLDAGCRLNLIYREEEREILPLCRSEKIRVIPYSPLASGRLTQELVLGEQSLRSETDQITKGRLQFTKALDILWSGSRELARES